MTSEWVSKKLLDVAKIVGGGTPSTTERSYWDGDVPWITPKDLSNYKDVYISNGGRSITDLGLKESSAKLVPKGTVLFTSRAPIGYVAIASQTVCTNQGFKSLVLNKGYDSRFFYYLLKQYTPEIEAKATGSTFKEISGYALGNFEVVIPDGYIQIKIADFLSAMDDRITLLRETNSTLEAIAQALFKSWFVDFDPVRAKQEGRQPEGMDEATAELFPDAFEESEFGLIPKGWTHISFGSLLSQTIGGDWGGEVADEINDTRVAIIRGTDIPDLQRSVGNRVPIRFTSQKKLATRKLEDGDIVIEVSGGSKDQPTGRSLHVTKALLDQFDCPVEPASFCRLMRPINKKIDSLLAQHMTYIYAQGKTWEYQNQSTGIANFQTTYFLENEMVVNPTETVLSAFSEIVQVLMGRTQTMQIQTLSNLRDTLLPRLISGQLRIADAQAELEKAMV